jgi:hypothetical protein
LRLATARGSFTFRRSSLTRRAALRLLCSGAWREMRVSEYHRSREVRAVSGTHPNKPMHPTADTIALIHLHLVGRRVIGGVRQLYHE